MFQNFYKCLQISSQQSVSYCKFFSIKISSKRKRTFQIITLRKMMASVQFLVVWVILKRDSVWVRRKNWILRERKFYDKIKESVSSNQTWDAFHHRKKLTHPTLLGIIIAKPTGIIHPPHKRDIYAVRENASNVYNANLLRAEYCMFGGNCNPRGVRERVEHRVVRMDGGQTLLAQLLIHDRHQAFHPANFKLAIFGKKDPFSRYFWAIFL